MSNFFNRLMYGRSNKPDYTKEALQKESRSKLFFDILGVKYGQLVKINLILIICMIPLIFWTWWNFMLSADLTVQEAAFYRIIYAAGLIPCLCLLAAPLAGITYIIRNFTQDKHVWLFKDFIHHTKANAKQAVLYMLIYSIVMFLGQIILYTYTIIMELGAFAVILRGFFLVMYILIALSMLYAFPMMVTYNLKLKHIIRNSLLLTIGSLHTTVLAPLLALVPFALFFALALVWNYGFLLLILYFLIFGLAFGLYIIISFTTAVFAKHLDNPDSQQGEDAEPEDE